MVATMMKNNVGRSSRKIAERGFSLIEVMISIAILLIGLLALAGTFGVAVASTANSQEDLIAKQKAMEAMESIYTARNTQQLGFASIANVNAAGGIFRLGYQPLLAAGADGLVGTNDDTNYPGCPGGVECITLPGPDGILGQGGDDIQMSLANFQRQITITSVLQPDGTPNPNLKQVQIDVQYTKPGLARTRTYTTIAYISSYR
jgi:prepilin-type N-terminal cleavage/methylation domain-containing protein